MDIESYDSAIVEMHTKSSSFEATSSTRYAINLFENVTSDELNDHDGMTGKRIQVYWDGDKVFYSAVIRGYVKESGAYVVVYDSDSATEIPVLEDLKSQPLNYVKVWRGDDDQYEIYRSTTESAHPKRKAAQNVTYNQQALERAAIDQYRLSAGLPPLHKTSGDKKAKKRPYTEMILEVSLKLLSLHKDMSCYIILLVIFFFYHLLLLIHFLMIGN